jgi:hypothetical protein
MFIVKFIYFHRVQKVFHLVEDGIIDLIDILDIQTVCQDLVTASHQVLDAPANVFFQLKNVTNDINQLFFVTTLKFKM